MCVVKDLSVTFCGKKPDTKIQSSTSIPRLVWVFFFFGFFSGGPSALLGNAEKAGDSAAPLTAAPALEKVVVAWKVEEPGTGEAVFAEGTDCPILKCAKALLALDVFGVA
jgi:hypothetical protein